MTSSTGLRLGGHDPLERGVAGLDHTGGHGDDGGQRALDLVVAGLGLALHLDGGAVDVDRLGEGDRRQVEQPGDLLGHRAGVAVARLGGGEDQVGALDPLDGGGQHLGGAQGIAAAEGRVADEDGLGGTHGERRAQTADLAVGGHRHEGDLAAAGGVDELEGHLDAVGVGLVEDELAVPLERFGFGIQRTRVGRVRDLLDADDDVHGDILCRESRCGQIQREARTGSAPAGAATVPQR